MILGKLTGKSTTNEFKFIVEKETKKFEFVQVHHKAYGFVLCLVNELEADQNKTIAYCSVLGYKEKDRVKKLRIPFEPNSEVLRAENDFIKEVIKLDSEHKAVIGKLDGKDIPVSIDLNKVLSMHLAVLAKSGSGKSYSVGVLLEEMIERKIPLLVIDPHGEYSTLKYKNTDEKDLKKLALYDLESKSYEVEEYGDSTINKGVRPLKLNINMQKEEIINLLPGKLSSSQLASLYSAFKQDPNNLDSLLFCLDQEETNTKYSLMSMVEHLRDLNLFTSGSINYTDFIKPGKCSIINLRGVEPEVQEIIVYKFSKELFELRKKEKVPPFFLVVEEAHNYCPERSFGETKSSKIIRNIASEGRKFGLGLCIISQRPARVDKSVLSQCSSQIILKVTNPNDLKALSSSIEGMTNNLEKEIQNLLIGQAIITGVADMPLVVNIRPRRTLHGGTAKDISQEKEDFMNDLKDFEQKEYLPLIKPNMSLNDFKLMNDKDKQIQVKLIPAKVVSCQDKEKYNLLIEMVNGEIVTDVNEFETKKIPDLSKLTKSQLALIKHGFKQQKFKLNELDNNMQEIAKKELENLKKLGYFEQKDKEISLTNEYALSKLNNYKSHDSIVFEEVPYNIKLTSKHKLKLNKFTNVLSEEDCFIVKYEAL